MNAHQINKLLRNKEVHKACNKISGSYETYTFIRKDGQVFETSLKTKEEELLKFLNITNDKTDHNRTSGTVLDTGDADEFNSEYPILPADEKGDTEVSDFRGYSSNTREEIKSTPSRPRKRGC